MATSKLKIKSYVNKEGLTPIYIQYTFESETQLFQTGEKVNPKLWVEKTVKLTT